MQSALEHRILKGYKKNENSEGTHSFLIHKSLYCAPLPSKKQRFFAKRLLCINQNLKSAFAYQNKNYQEKIRLQTQERVIKIDAPIPEDAPIATLFVDGAQIETSNENPFFLSS